MKSQCLFLTALSAAVLAAQPSVPPQQPRGAPLQLQSSESLAGVLSRPPKPDPAVPPKNGDTGVRPAILNLQPAGDPIYLVDDPPYESSIDTWRTYQRPKVDAFSRNGDGIAIQGYDIVSYQEDHAEKGRLELQVEFGGVTWYFASADHRDSFRQAPETFVPKYGGFCAYSVGRGFPATADPRAYVVQDHKVYLFFDKAVQTVWEQDERHLIDRADRYWPKLHR